MIRKMLLLLFLCSVARATMIVENGSVDVTTYFVLRDAADGTATTGATITNIDLQYVEQGAAPSTKADATALGSVGATHSDNGAIEVDATDAPGLYRVDWPDAAFDGGAGKIVILSVKLSGSFTEHLLVNLSPSVNITHVQEDVVTDNDDGMLQVNVEEIDDNATAAQYLEDAFDGSTGYAFTGCTMPTVTTLTGHTAQTGDTFGQLPTNFSSLAILATGEVGIDLDNTQGTLSDAEVDNTVQVDVVTIETLDATNQLDTAADTVTVTSIGTDVITAASIQDDAVGAAEAGFLTDSTGFQGADIGNILTDTSTTLDDFVDDLETRLPETISFTGGNVHTHLKAADDNVIVDANQADFFTLNSGETYSSSVSGSVVKEIADNAGGANPGTIADEVVAHMDANSVDFTTIIEDTGTTLDDLVDDLETRIPSAFNSTGITNWNIVYNTDFATNYDADQDRWAVDVNTVRGETPKTDTDIYNRLYDIVPTDFNAVGITSNNLHAHLKAADDNVEVDVNHAQFFLEDSGTTYASSVSGSLVKETADNAGGSSLTEAGIADAVWNELSTGHTDAGKAGQQLWTDVDAVLADTGTDGVIVQELKASALADFFNTDSGTTYASSVSGSVVKETADNAGGSSLTVADIADGVWDEAIADHTTETSFGGELQQLDPNVTAILADTGTDGVVLADNAITAAKIDTAAIGADEIATGAIGVDEFAAEADNIGVNFDDITGTLDDAEVANNVQVDVVTIETVDATNQLDTAADTVTVTSMSAGVITSTVMATDSVGADELADDAVDEVWDEPQSGHTTAGTFGKYLDTEVSGVGGGDAGTIADEVVAHMDANSVDLNTIVTNTEAYDTDAEYAAAIWNAALSSHTTETSFGGELQQLDPNVTAILADTGTDGVVLADNAITAAKIDTDAIGSDEIATGAIGTDEFAAEADNIGVNFNDITGTLDDSEVADDVQVDVLTIETLDATNQLDTAADTVTVTSMAADVMTASALATDAGDEVADQVWDELQAGHTTADTFGKYLDTEVSGVGGGDAGTIADEVVAHMDANSVDLNAILEDTGTTLDDLVDDLETRLPQAITFDTGNVEVHLKAADDNVIVDVNQADFFTVDSGETYSSSVAGSVVKETADNAGGSALTEAGIADAVWDELSTGHTDAGKAGAQIWTDGVPVDELKASALADMFNTNSGETYSSSVSGSPVKETADNAGGSSLTEDGIADAVWDEDAGDHETLGTTGWLLKQLRNLWRW